jgi:hypothetical protein
MVKKYLKIILRIFLVLLGLYILLYSVAAIYISANKKKVAAQLIALLNDQINGKINSADVDLSLFANLPGIGVALKDVTITDSLFPQHQHALLKAKKIDARVSVYNLLFKKQALTKISVSDAVIDLFTDTTGYSNQSIFTRKKKTATAGSSSTSNELEKISLKNVVVQVNDLKRRKKHLLTAKDVDVKFSAEDGATILHTEALINVGQLGFNWRKGAYLKNVMMEGAFDLKSKDSHLSFDSINIRLDGNPFNMTGDFHFDPVAPVFSLRIHTPKILFEKVRSMLPEKISGNLSIIQANKPLSASVQVAGPLKGGEPLVNIKWAAKQTDLATPFFDFEEASFTGSYNNQLIPGLPPGDPNSKIVINNFLASWHGLPVKMPMIEIINLQEPLLTTSLQSAFPLTALNETLQSDVLDLQTGNADVLLNYQGPMVRNEATNTLISGHINISNGQILYAPRNVTLNDVDGRISFKNSDLLVEKLNCNVFNTSVQMNGTGRQLLSLLNTAPSNAILEWNIFTPGINLENFLFLFKQRNKEKVKRKGTKKTLAGAADKIDKLLEDGSLQVNLKANQVSYKKFKAVNLLADISMLQDRYLFNNISMGHAGGTLQFNGSLVQSNRTFNQATLNAKLNAVDVSEVLNAFDNFGQDAITAANIDGKLQADIKSNISITDAGKVMPETINSTVNFSLKNGTLKNFEPIKKIQDYAFKKRDFENVQFAELKNTLTIKNREVYINRMEIQSSVISLFVEGIYSTKGNTDISIQLPLSNLKKRKDGYVPKNIGVDAKTGSSIFLRGQPGKDGNIKFSLDLFKRFYKEKK